MKLSDLKAIPGATKAPTRKGRGPGSGNGKTGGRGHKGQKARSGGGVRPGFEGGQMPLYMRMPKIGFNNKVFATVYAEVNLNDLNKFDEGAVVDAQALLDKKIIKKDLDGIKVLSTGNLEKKLTVKVAKVSKAAREKIEAAGGTVEEV